MNREDAIKVCRLIAGLVVTDDDLDDREDAFIERMLARFGIPSSERDLIFPIVDASEAAAALRELPKDTQQTAVDLLLQAAVVDTKIAPEERTYLETVADAVGMARADLDKRLGDALAAAGGSS
jgi:uncharacterized tellurite resistance protein B-like protein